MKNLIKKAINIIIVKYMNKKNNYYNYKNIKTSQFIYPTAMNKIKEIIFFFFFFFNFKKI